VRLGQEVREVGERCADEGIKTAAFRRISRASRVNMGMTFRLRVKSSLKTAHTRHNQPGTKESLSFLAEKKEIIRP
jgi:hypothetical protein